MAETQGFGYFLVAVSAALLAQHWHAWRQGRRAEQRTTQRAFELIQLQRRAVASGLIGIVGAAMTAVDRVPRTAWALSAYLFALVLGGFVVLAIALSDLRAMRRRRDELQFDMLAAELRKAKANRADARPVAGAQPRRAGKEFTPPDATAVRSAAERR